ncbi:hypothetical protein HMI54_004890 [Coelomomyces lativittatus]|nr:hypothetical protein HMI54_004890 [Coelomomyces lativittatus]
MGPIRFYLHFLFLFFLTLPLFTTPIHVLNEDVHLLDKKARTKRVGPGHRSFGPNQTPYYSLSTHSSKNLQTFLTSKLLKDNEDASTSPPPQPLSSKIMVSIALQFLKKTTGIPTTQMVVKNQYTSSHNGITHIYLRQLHQDLEIVNADANINLDR